MESGWCRRCFFRCRRAGRTWKHFIRFTCEDVGHKKVMCPHRQLVAGPVLNESGAGISGRQVLDGAVPLAQGEATVDPAGAMPPAHGETVLFGEDAAPPVRGEVGVSPADASALVLSEVSGCMTTTKSKERVEAEPTVSTSQNGDEMRKSGRRGEGGAEQEDYWLSW